jgi:hypothetical protein
MYLCMANRVAENLCKVESGVRVVVSPPHELLASLVPEYGQLKSAQVPLRAGSGGAQYYELPPSDAARASSSPPCYERSVLARLHEVLGLHACQHSQIQVVRSCSGGQVVLRQRRACYR